MVYSKLDQFEDIGKSLIDGMIFCGCKINFQDNEISKSEFSDEIKNRNVGKIRHEKTVYCYKGI
jgi:hypothetical protein